MAGRAYNDRDVSHFGVGCTQDFAMVLWPGISRAQCVRDAFDPRYSDDTMSGA